MSPKKAGFSETPRSWMVLIFTARIEGTLIHLYMKKKIEKKIFLAQERGGPLNMYKNNKEIKKSIYSYYRL
jgi:hypothetical protein